MESVPSLVEARLRRGRRRRGVVGVGGRGREGALRPGEAGGPQEVELLEAPEPRGRVLQGGRREDVARDLFDTS